MFAPVATTIFDAYDDSVAKLGRQPREGQRELVSQGTNLQPGDVRLFRAPTATGKSLAALMIAGFRWERDDTNRTVIATYTKLLQDQYARTSTDPELQTDLDQARLLFPGMRFAVLKGATNYLCRARAAKMSNRVGDEFSQLATGEGDPGEVKDAPRGTWKAKAEADKCADHTPDQCGFQAAKARARRAHCVITNHALVMVAASNANVLGKHSLLIVDEIHNLPRAADSFATKQIDMTELAIEADKEGEFQEAEVYRTAQKMINPGDQWNDRIPSVEELQRVAEIVGLRKAELLYKWMVSAVEHYQTGGKGDYMATVEKKMFRAADSKRVLKRSAIDIGRVTSRALRTELTLQKGEESEDFERAILLMSATTGTTTHPTYVAERCGTKAELVQVKSALDYPSQMQVSMLDLPSGWDFSQAVTQLCRETEGRTLVLCRSWKMVNDIDTHMFGQQLPFRVFKQDQEFSSNNGGVVRRFKDDETSVLIGTASFFEGIDIPGPALSQVIITQLPMLMTMDPLAAERKRRLGARFIPDSQIPHTALILEQMMGRLIRSTSDRGLVVVLDPKAQRGWEATSVRHAVDAFGSPMVSRRDALAWYREGAQHA